MVRLALATFWLAGCLSNGAGLGGDGDDVHDDDAGPDAGTSPDAGDGTSPVCDRWNADRADLAEGAWSGDAATCEAGDVADTGRENALRLVNLYRWMVGLGPVDHDTAFDASAQACALMMHAEGRLSHEPTADWACYSDDGAYGAGRSLEDLAPGVTAVDVYMIDPGNETTLGHRRNVLSQWLRAVGIGSTDQASCLYTDVPAQWIEGWIAWPPPGAVPAEALAPLPYFGSLDEVGWSIQTTTIDLAGAEVTVRDGDAALEVETWQLEPGYGSSYAIAFRPVGWAAQVGHTYDVEVLGVTPPIAYSVEIVDCSL